MYVNLKLKDFYAAAHLNLKLKDFYVAAHINLKLKDFYVAAHLNLKLKDFYVAAHINLELKDFYVAAHINLELKDFYAVCSLRHRKVLQSSARSVLSPPGPAATLQRNTWQGAETGFDPIHVRNIFWDIRVGIALNFFLSGRPSSRKDRVPLTIGSFTVHPI
jgi:hypothetical protein